MASSFDPRQYETFCREWALSDEDFGRWRDVGEKLGPRPDWRFGVGGNPPGIVWTFGVEGAWRLVLSAGLAGELVMYTADTDRDVPLGRIERVMAWLEEHEHEHAGLTPLQVELLAETEED